MTPMEILSDTSRNNTPPNFTTISLETYLITTETKELYQKFEKNGYPSIVPPISLKIIEAFVEWADKNIRYMDHILVFKELFEKAFMLFQISTHRI